MTFSMIATFIAAHWHKVVAVLALFMALYNKFSHNKMLTFLTSEIKQLQSKTKKRPHKKVK